MENNSSLLDIIIHKFNLNNISYPHLGVSILIGFIIGYLLKKSFKIIIYSLGIIIFSLLVIDSQDFFQIDGNVLEEYISKSSNYLHLAINYLKESLKEMYATNKISFLIGFLIGLKMG